MRSANLIGQEWSSDHIDLYFIFQWARSIFMRGGAIPRGPFTTELLLWYCAMLLWREIDSLQLMTLYLTLTPIFSGRKAKINLHTMPKLTVVMPISCLLRSIQSTSPQNDAISLFSCNFVVCFDCFQSSPAIKLFRELTDCCLVYPTCFAIRLCFLQSLNKDSTISLCWGSFLFLSKPFWQMMLFVTKVNEWRHMRWRNYSTHSNEHPC